MTARPLSLGLGTIVGTAGGLIGAGQSIARGCPTLCGCSLNTAPLRGAT